MTAPDGEEGTAFWPCFFWIGADLLRTTDLVFEPQVWTQGMVVPGLDWRAESSVTAETMVCLSWQLRARTDRFRIVSQGRLGSESGRVSSGDHGPWFHVGSVGLRRVSLDEMRNQPEELARRIGWHRWYGGDAYQQWLDELAESAHIKPKHIAPWRDGYGRWLSWLS